MKSHNLVEAFSARGIRVERRAVQVGRQPVGWFQAAEEGESVLFCGQRGGAVRQLAFFPKQRLQKGFFGSCQAAGGCVHAHAYPSKAR